MREGIHPDYYQAKVVCNCGTEFVTGSTKVQSAIHSTQDSRRHHLLAEELISSTRSTVYQTINFELRLRFFGTSTFFECIQNILERYGYVI